MFYPDNFFYFIICFSICIFSGTYLLYAYGKDRLLSIMTWMFYFCAIRFCTEYYLPQVDEFTTATNIAIFHGVLVTFIVVGNWYCAFVYVRPFQLFKKEKLFNQIYLWLVLIIPNLIVLYGLVGRQIFYYYPEKIDGYWQYSMYYDRWITTFYITQSYILMMVIMVGIFLYSILIVKRQRIKKIFLLISYVIVPTLFSQYIIAQTQDGDTSIPNFAILFLIHIMILVWFFSDYLLFRDTFSKNLREILVSVSDTVICTDRHYSVIYQNELATQQFFSHTKQKNFIRILEEYTDLSKDEIISILSSLMQTKTDREFSLTIKEEPKIFRLKVAELTQDNQQVGYTFLLTDLTEIKQQEKQLRELNQAKDQLFSIIGHDLRKPALAFRGISKKINYLIQNQDFEKLYRMGGQLEKSAFSLNQLLDNLLNWAMQQRNMIPHAPQRFLVQDALKEEMAMFHPMAREKNINLEIKILEDVTVFCDVHAFKTIIRNLLDNAIKFTPVNGCITIEATNVKDYLQLQISDTGLGIATARLERLFELQENKGTVDTDGKRSTGLGLSLVKGLTHHNQGQIQVFSEEHKGTRFEMLLPNYN